MMSLVFLNLPKPLQWHTLPSVSLTRQHHTQRLVLELHENRVSYAGDAFNKSENAQKGRLQARCTMLSRQGQFRIAAGSPASKGQSRDHA
jgi:hypothetical protein